MSKPPFCLQVWDVTPADAHMSLLRLDSCCDLMVPFLPARSRRGHSAHVRRDTSRFGWPCWLRTWNNFSQNHLHYRENCKTSAKICSSDYKHVFIFFNVHLTFGCTCTLRCCSCRSRGKDTGDLCYRAKQCCEHQPPTESVRVRCGQVFPSLPAAALTSVRRFKPHSHTLLILRFLLHRVVFWSRLSPQKPPSCDNRLASIANEVVYVVRGAGVSCWLEVDCRVAGFLLFFCQIRTNYRAEFTALPTVWADSAHRSASHV